MHLSWKWERSIRTTRLWCSIFCSPLFGSPSYAALPYPSTSKNTQISVVAKMSTDISSNVICLVNGIPRIKDRKEENYCSAVLYYENVNLETFKHRQIPAGGSERGQVPAVRRCEVKPAKGEGYVTWEGQEGRVWGTSVCNTIRSP